MFELYYIIQFYIIYIRFTIGGFSSRGDVAFLSGFFFGGRRLLGPLGLLLTPEESIMF